MVGFAEIIQIILGATDAVARATSARIRSTTKIGILFLYWDNGKRKPPVRKAELV
jgi:hypothetical protein